MAQPEGKLARRYKTKLGEIDIVVRRGGILAFVEVKARADFLSAAAPHHDVDLAELGLVASRQHGIAGEPEAPHGAQFSDMAQPMGRLAGLDRHEEASRLSSRARA